MKSNKKEIKERKKLQKKREGRNRYKGEVEEEQ